MTQAKPSSIGLWTLLPLTPTDSLLYSSSCCSSAQLTFRNHFLQNRIFLSCSANYISGSLRTGNCRRYETRVLLLRVEMIATSSREAVRNSETLSSQPRSGGAAWRTPWLKDGMKPVSFKMSSAVAYFPYQRGSVFALTLSLHGE